MTAEKKAATKQGAELPVLAEETYLFLDPTLDVAGAIEDNLSGESLDRSALTNVRVPGGGSPLPARRREALAERQGVADTVPRRHAAGCGSGPSRRKCGCQKK